MAHIDRRPDWLLVLSFTLLFASCNQPTREAEQQNDTAAPTVTGHWAVQFRSPASEGLRGPQLSSFWYSSISVVSQKIVFVAGDMPGSKDPAERKAVVVRTTDGGSTWTELFLDQAGVRIPTLNSISFVSPTLGWVVGLDSAQKAIAGKTTDAGATWAISTLGVNQAPTSVFFIDENTGWMGGTTSTGETDEETEGPSDILHTTDGGATWKAQRRVPVSILDFSFVDRNNGWAGGGNGIIYHTDDGGRVWSQQRTEIEFDIRVIDPKQDRSKNFLVSGVHFLDRQTGFAAAEAVDQNIGRILGTTNGGEVWARRLIANSEKITDVHFISPMEGWAVTSNGAHVYYTNDGGRYWLSEPVRFEQIVPFQRLGAAGEGYVWAVGGGGIFFRMPN